MRWRHIAVVLLAAPLAACFDFTADSVFRRDGTAQVTAELGVSMHLATLLASQSRQGQPDFLADCEKDRAADTLPAGVGSIRGKRSQRGDMALCTYLIELSDPVAASDAQRARVRSAPGLRGLDRSDLRLERLRDGVYRLSGQFKPVEDPLARQGQQGDELAANAMLLAMTANRYVTLSVSAVRIENTTGELQAGGRKVVWKLPLLALVKTMPGVGYDIRADIVYAESLTDRIKRWFGIE
jgi:hypothetical protein